MSADSFQQLFDGFSDTTSVKRQTLVGNEDGVFAFSATVQDVVFNVMHTPSTHPGLAFLLTDFGPPPKDKLAPALHALMTVNFTMLGEDPASCFSIHPGFGNVTLQSHYRIEGRSGAHLFKSMNKLAALALQWRQTYFLEAQTQPHAEAPRTLSPSLETGLRA